MKTTSSLTLALTLALFSTTAWGAEDCDDAVFVDVDEQAGTVSPKDVFVCQNGTVEWSSAGPSRFQVIFPGQRAGPTTRDDGTTHVIQATAPPGEYVYDVRIGNRVLDPRIIIR